MSEDANEAQDVFLSVEPSETLKVGYAQRVELKVIAEDGRGNPLSEIPVRVSFVGSSHNGSLSPSVLSTDGEGVGRVVFTAPDKSVQFQIRFVSPVGNAESVVEVGVDPSLVSLTVPIGYAGTRQVVRIEGRVFSEITCEDLLVADEVTPVAEQEAQGVPEQVAFDGLRLDAAYAVTLMGLGDGGVVLAEACRDGLSAGADVDQVALSDVLFDVGGAYLSRVYVEASDNFIEVVDVVKEPFVAVFLESIESKIMDAVQERVVSEQPFAEETFILTRQQRRLDELLSADFEERELDLEGLLAPVWDGMCAHMHDVEFRGRLEIGSDSMGELPLYHRVESVVFRARRGEGDVPVEVELPQTGFGVVTRLDSPPDTLSLGRHSISLGLGDLLQGLYSSVFVSEFGPASLPGVLLSEVDCDYVAALLGAELADVVAEPEIVAGCEAAISRSEQWVLAGFVDVSMRFSQLIMEGRCFFVEPETGSHVGGLTNGELQVLWEGDGELSDGLDSFALGPMQAQFEADIAEER